MLSQQLADQVFAWAADEGVDTPAFLFAPATLRAGVAGLRAGLGARVSYATKANAHPMVLRALEPLVEEFNVTNPAHLDTLLGLGVTPGRIAYLNPVCARRTLEAVLARGVTRFVVDDARGLAMLPDGVKITLRLRPPDAGESTRSVVRFGNTAEVLADLAKRAADRGIEVEALSFFVGTAGAGMEQALPYLRGIEALLRLRERLDRAGIAVPTLNIGGGFPGSRDRFHRDHPDFFQRIAKALPSGVDVLCEPGRYLCQPAMAMLSRVVADRAVAGRRMVHLDASSYAGLFETTFIEPEQGLEFATRPGARTPAAVLGPVMDSFDVIARQAPLPPLAEGDLVLIPNTGAYTWGYTAPVEGLAPAEPVELPPDLDEGFAKAWFGSGQA
ncbi:hypothetical protein [Thermoactinospora rubra]|uniref:hypothetical protein n=1 Tax=Thermoactinospora rubra TaxID=1088767 RepID=UPI000A115C2E|nr:hypothetical protein [Thermoactinospora rubra]